MASYDLIYNPQQRHLYKFDGHLLRTPLYKQLQLTPDAMSYYDVAGSYMSAMPTAGVVSTTETNIWLNTVKSGKTMRGYYLQSGTPTAQIWRAVTTSHEPEFVFYHGAFSPSANSMQGGMAYGEAFVKIPAYHFSIPQELAGFRVVSGALTVTHGGCIHSYGFPKTGLVATRRDNYGMAYYAAQCPTSRLAANDEWRTNWTHKLGVYSALDNDLRTMHANGTEDVELDTCRTLGGGLVDDLYYLDQGRYNKVVGQRVIWSNTYTGYYDGSIPVSPNPWVQQITLGAATLAKIAALGGGWLVFTPEVAVSSGRYDNTSTDYPFYYPSNTTSYAWWLCCSYWGFGLKLTMEA